MALTDKLTAIGNAIRTKTGGSALISLSDMPAEILSIETGGAPLQNPALILMDWEGTKLAEYSRDDALALTELPAPNTLKPYAYVDHEFQTFRAWNWDLITIKEWIQEHMSTPLNVGAVYTTTDSADHNYWANPRLITANTVSRKKRGTAFNGNNECQNYKSLRYGSFPDGNTTIPGYFFNGCFSLQFVAVPNNIETVEMNVFTDCHSLKKVILPSGLQTIGNLAFYNDFSMTEIIIPSTVTEISGGAFRECQTLQKCMMPKSLTTLGGSAFNGCCSLSQINIPKNVARISEYTFVNCVSLCDVLNESKAALANVNAFNGLPTNYLIYVPRENLSWFESETNWSTIYAQGHIVAIEDYIEYLETLGFNVDEYKEAA